MPTVGVYEDAFCAAMGEQMTEQEFDELCFDFGLELDEVTNEYEIVKKERGVEAAEGKSKRTLWKVDVPANRYDLLCVEGLSQALRAFRGTMMFPTYNLHPLNARAELKIVVKAATAQIRPFVVGAILRNIAFTDDSYKSFIDLQDKLHQNIARKRSLVAIGTHDLDSIQGPFTYEAKKPEDIRFIALKQTQEMSAKELMEAYEKDLQLRAYLGIIRDSPVYPVIYDANGVVLSMPPIINGEHSKITLATKNVFIESTATDLTKANIVLNTLVANFSVHCTPQFEVEPVLVEYEQAYPSNNFIKSGESHQYPNLDPRPVDVSAAWLRKNLKLQEKLTPAQVRNLLQKMSIVCTLDADADTLHCQIPITRSDVMHPVDLLEDLAIAYGYNNLEAEVPQTITFPQEQPINHLSDFLRVEIAMNGYHEALNWGLVSVRENFDNLRRKPMEINGDPASPWEYQPFALPVSLSNPKTKDFEVVRTSLLPGLLKTLACNKHNPAPIKFFEVSDVVVQDTANDTGAKNIRRAAAVIMGMTSNFEKMHGLLDQIMLKLKLRAHFDDSSDLAARDTYSLVASEDPAFFKGKQAHIRVKDVNIGIIGVLHPEVLGPFDLALSTSALEFNVEPFLTWL